jgi:hypothetical protein
MRFNHRTRADRLGGSDIVGDDVFEDVFDALFHG